MPFIDRLKASLALKLGQKQLTFPAGGIKRLSVEAHSYGFTATVEWWVVCQQSESEDTLFADFIKPDPVDATLTLDRAWDIEGEEASPLALTGRVEERQVRERAFLDVDGAPILQRGYRVRFSDRAAVLWRQHFPTGVWVDQGLQQVIEAQAPQGVTLSFQWEGAKTKYPLHTLGLGADGNEASFLDFLHWVQDQENAGLFYDCAADTYALRDGKPTGGKAVLFPRDDVEELEVRFPEPPREQVVVLNSCVGASTRKKEVANAQKAPGVRRDVLLTSAIENDLTQRATLEGQRQRAATPGLLMRFARYPSVTLTPNGLYGFADDWSAKHYTNGKQYRLHHLRIEARAEDEDPAAHVGDDTNSYHLDVTAALELDSDPTFQRPAFVRPHWPFHAEATVLSQVGEDAERTYQSNADAQTSLESYRVTLPLWDTQLLVPYNPNLQPGHFYFPVDKGARVLVSLQFRDAFLKRFLDWRPGAKLPKESQGNHLLMGKKAESETSIQHVYQDSKPLLRIQRTSDKDTQLIEVSEGRLYLEARDAK